MSLVHDMSVAYALEGLDGIERLRYEHHLAECAECRSDVGDVREAAELLSEGIELAPPAALRERVLAIADAQVEPTLRDHDSPGGQRAGRPRRRWFGNGG